MLVLNYSLSVCTYILCLIQVLYSCIHSNWPQMKGESDFYKKTVSLDLHWNNYVLFSALLHPSYLKPLYVQDRPTFSSTWFPPLPFGFPHLHHHVTCHSKTETSYKDPHFCADAQLKVWAIIITYYFDNIIFGTFKKKFHTTSWTP